jgi:mRNA interferase RelE/StbE
MYNIEYTNKFKRELDNLSSDVKERIQQIIENEIKHNPYIGKQLKGKYKGLWRYRVEKYRIIYHINEKDKLITFIEVGLRESVYR